MTHRNVAIGRMRDPQSVLGDRDLDLNPDELTQPCLLSGTELGSYGDVVMTEFPSAMMARGEDTQKRKKGRPPKGGGGARKGAGRAHRAKAQKEKEDEDEPETQEPDNSPTEAQSNGEGEDESKDNEAGVQARNNPPASSFTPVNKITNVTPGTKDTDKDTGNQDPRTPKKSDKNPGKGPGTPGKGPKMPGNEPMSKKKKGVRDPETDPYLKEPIKSNKDSIELVYPVTNESRAWMRPHTIESFQKVVTKIYPKTSNLFNRESLDNISPTSVSSSYAGSPREARDLLAPNSQVAIKYMRTAASSTPDNPQYDTILAGPIPSLSNNERAWGILDIAVRDAEEGRIYVLKHSVSQKVT